MQKRDARGIRLELNPGLGVPVYRQIVDGIKELVAASVLKPGDQLPSVRELSAQLRINPASAVKAYGELRYQHVIDMDQGRGTFVASNDQVAAQSRDEILEHAISALLSRARTLGVAGNEVLEMTGRLVRAEKKGRKKE